MGRQLDLEVAHAVLYVCDPEAMIDFYTRVLGFEVTDRGPLGGDGGEEIVFLSQTARHHHQLAFITGRQQPGPSDNLNHVAYRSSGTLDDLRALSRVLQAESGAGNVRPITHGNAWSVYFTDPEGNGVEVFIDTPWHVAQPQGRQLDLDRSDEEIVEWTEREFRAEPEFGSLAEFYTGRAEHLAERSEATDRDG